MKNAARICAVLSLVLGLYGCSGGDSENINNVRTTTIGQELVDLQSALDSKVITQRKFEQQKKQILAGN